MSDHIETHYGNLPAGEDTNLVLGSVFQYGIGYYLDFTDKIELQTQRGLVLGR